MLRSRLRHHLSAHLETIVHKALTYEERVCLRGSGLFTGTLVTVVDKLTEDLKAFVERDPAAHGSYEMILEAASSFRAVMHYRLAHELWQLKANSGWDSIAVKLSTHGKLASGVDIHPGARIGSRIVLDHAYGTVIGETCRIGDDAYILGGVTLGSLGIANNAPEQRHPTLGNNVQIGAFARILGAIDIGDNVFISPNCVVTENIPSNSRVSIVNQIQLERLEQKKARIAPRFIGSYVEGNRFIILCQGFSYLTATLLDKNYRPISSSTVSPNPKDNRRYEIRFPLSASEARNLLQGQFHVSLSDSSSALTLLNPKGLDELIAQMAFPEPAMPPKENLPHDYSY